jgi:hypothetical protein
VDAVSRLAKPSRSGARKGDLDSAAGSGTIVRRGRRHRAAPDACRVSLADLVRLEAWGRRAPAGPPPWLRPAWVIACGEGPLEEEVVLTPSRRQLSRHEWLPAPALATTYLVNWPPGAWRAVTSALADQHRCTQHLTGGQVGTVLAN